MKGGAPSDPDRSARLMREVVRLEQWRLENFKSIRSATLTLGPLTVLVGANSSGKSSVLQSILLVVQAMREATGTTSGEGTFALNGDLVGLGRFEDLRTWPSEDAPLAPIRLGATLHTVRTRRAPGEQWLRKDLNWLLTLEGLQEDTTLAKVTQLRAEVDAGPLNVEALELVRLEGSSVERLLEVSGAGVGSMLPLQYQGQFDDGAGNPSSVAKVHAARFRAFLPMRLLHRGPLPELAADRWIDRRSLGWQFAQTAASTETSPIPDEILRDVAKRGVQESLGGLYAALDKDWMKKLRPYGGVRGVIEQGGPRLRQLLIEMFQEEIDNTNDLTQNAVASVNRSLSVLEESLGGIAEWYATRVHYLGPLRQEPQPAYPFGPPGALGKKGEHAALKLHRNGGDFVVCPPTPEDWSRGGFPMRRTLAEAVRYWGNYLGLFDHIEVSAAGRQGVRLSIFTSQGSQGVDSTSVGVGVSQMLPVLMVCLTAREGDLILLEQPELHLHPRVQQRLADFLLGVAESGRQVIVETHSEYLVTRLRRRIAESKSAAPRSLIRILFAEWDEEHGTSFRDVKPTELGTLDDWPEGFFDESSSDAEALLAAAARKLAGES